MNTFDYCNKCNSILRYFDTVPNEERESIIIQYICDKCGLIEEIEKY